MAITTLAKGYEPEEVEARWREYWQERETFTPDPDDSGEPYSIVIPPPNVTGALHMGHALNITIQDIMCRYMRQQGRNVLWVPGCDHAGIATQNVVERRLKEEGVSRHELGREKFLERVWGWKSEYEERIHNQIRWLGASVDWTRVRFTMDEGLSRAVREVFVRLYEEGLIYRGDYIINWCVRCHTALADDEVEYAPRDSKIYHLRYPLEDGSGHVVVATTRPETMLGDTAVAVHPEDERYQHMHGRNVILPLQEKPIPVITDTYVDREFGTGCLKITPAHDVNDWHIGEKHGLPVVKVIDDEGNMNEAAGPAFMGMSKEAARKKVMEMLETRGLVEKVEDYSHNVGECYRCKTVIEPNVSTQWFVAVKPLAEKARAAVDLGQTTIFPAQWTKIYFDWLDNIRDWCISRQLWWGHRIPVWYCDACPRTIASREDIETCPDCGGEVRQDEDVLDTWFSSALWPFSTLGWPEETRELQKWYPTSLLVTGFDIIFFWVARMMMMGLHFQEKVPFDHVYIHALVRDEDGKKMSKSTGNVIDPIEMIDKYGCDSLRFTLTSFAAMGRDIKLSEARIEGYRHFVNKIWNAARFALMNLPEELPGRDVRQAKGLPHEWILHRLEQVKRQMSESIEGYAFNEAAQTMYSFVWHEFCDWYLEMIKPELNGDDEDARAMARQVLGTALQEIMVLMHPIMPFVTREIWGHLPSTPVEDLAEAGWPELRPELEMEGLEDRMSLLQEVIVAVRNIRGELNIPPSHELDAMIRTQAEADEVFLAANAELISLLARLGTIEIGPTVQPPKATASSVVRSVEVHVPLAGAIDFDAELARIAKEQGKLDKEMNIVNKKLSNEDFVTKAPAHVVENERTKMATLAEKKETLESLRTRLAAAMEEEGA